MDCCVKYTHNSICDWGIRISRMVKKRAYALAWFEPTCSLNPKLFGGKKLNRVLAFDQCLVQIKILIAYIPVHIKIFIAYCTHSYTKQWYLPPPPQVNAESRGLVGSSRHWNHPVLCKTCQKVQVFLVTWVILCKPGSLGTCETFWLGLVRHRSELATSGARAMDESIVVNLVQMGAPKAWYISYISDTEAWFIWFPSCFHLNLCEWSYIVISAGIYCSDASSDVVHQSTTNFCSVSLCGYVLWRSSSN